MIIDRLFAFTNATAAAFSRGRLAVGTVMSSFLNFFTPQRTRRLAVSLSAAFVIVVVMAGYAEAQTANPAGALVDTIGSGIFVVLNKILLIIIQTVAQLASLVVSLLVAISQFNKFSTVKVVDIGWTIVKDVSNMLFIIALLVIAAGTVLRLENYRYNRLLSNLIIMAFLTNFSKFIAAFFIQGAQVLMLTFVNAYKEALFGNFVSAFGLDQVLRFSPDTTTLGGAAVFSNLLAGLILVVIALIITAAICVVFFVRIVALWILVILSPFAFASQILPNTKSFASKWWSEFGKYTVQGPILAFFLWLALAIVSVGSGAAAIDPALGEITNQANAARGGANFFQVAIFTLDNLMTFIISAAFLVFGLNYATSSSGVAGKWAGKVASAGFAGAAAIGGTVSGINAVRNSVRDRVVAPIQGWQKNREDQRRATVAERTQTLVNAGDRLRGAMPAPLGVGREGQEKARAAAAVYERQRTQRFVTARGLNDMTTEALQDRAQKSGDQRERLAALQVLQGRGAVNLGDTAQRAAFEKTISNQRIPAGDKKKLREEMLSNYAKGLNGDQLRDELKGSASKDDRIVFARRLQEVNALKVGNGDDENIVRNLRTDLADSPEKLRAFDESMMKTNQDMAKKVLFNDLATVGDRRNLLLAVQQKQISASVLDDDTQAKFAAAGEQGAIANHLVENSRDEATLRALYNQMDPEAAREIFSHLDMKDEASTDRRAMVARVTGEWGKAFTDATGWMEKEEKKLDASGNVMLDDAGQEIVEKISVAKAYMDKLGGDGLAKNISADSLKDKKVLKTMNSMDNMKFPHWEAIRNRNKETRTALAAGLGEYADELAKSSPNGKLDLDPKNKENNFVASNLALASKGKDLRYDLTSESGKKAYESLVRGGKAADLAKLDESDAYLNQGDEVKKYMTQAYGIHADPAKIADMLQFENYDFAKESLEAGEAELLERIEKKGDMKAYSRLTQMARHPVLSGFVDTPEKPNKKGGDVGVAGAIGAGALGRASGESDRTDRETKEEKAQSQGDYKRTRIGFRRDQDEGPDTGGTPAPTQPTKPRGPSGAPQNILIGNLTPEQREARQQIINVRQANRGQIPDAQFDELAEKILGAEDLKRYKTLESSAASLSDDDRKLLSELRAQVGVRAVDANDPLDGLSPEQLALRKSIVDSRRDGTRQLDTPERIEKILSPEEKKLFDDLRDRKPEVGRSAEETQMLKNLNTRVGFLEHPTDTSS